jgi:hypothetical protein
MSKLDSNGVDKAIEKYLHKIILNKTQHDRVTSAVGSLRQILSSDEYSQLPNATKTYLQGSFITRTTLQPRIEVNESAEYDADLVAESTKWNVKNPSSALEAVFKTLVNSRVPQKAIEIKSSCVRIQYADGPKGEKFHVDITPILSHGDEQYVASCKDNKNEWRKSNPSKLSNWFNTMSVNLPTFRAQYLIMKRLAQVNDIKIPSIALQKIVSDSYQFKPQSGKYIRELLNLCRTASVLLNNPDYQLLNPVNSGENLTKRIKSTALDEFRKILTSTTKRIEQFAMDSSEENLADIFGYGFPNKLGHDFERSLRSSNMYFDCDYADRVSLNATCNRGIIDGNEYTLTVSADHQNHPKLQQVLDKMTFSLKDYFKNHTIKWQVLNDPSEVSFQVRGHFYESNSQPNGYHSRSENVNWAGKHWVRAYVMQSDRCKFISSRFMVNVLRADA